MNRTAFVVVLVASLSVSSANAQSLRESISRAAEQAAAQPAQNGKIPPKYLWWGVSLLAVGSVFIVNAALMDTEGATCVLDTCVENSTIRTGRFAIGGGLAGVGAFLLAKGISKSHQNSPSVTFVPGGGVVIGRRFSF